MLKKLGLMVIMAMLATAFFVTDSSAAPAGYNCTVDATGPYSGTIYIQLTSASNFTGKWFTAPAGMQKEILAIALTAMSNGFTVFVYADLGAGSVPPIQGLYLLK
ncbi:MAG: hypothetical protein JXD19_05485 [Deltaproteobacteria bacterium]|nr:hypothetical protein [Deltaproteobacteria bacterium]